MARHAGEDIAPSRRAKAHGVLSRREYWHAVVGRLELQASLAVLLAFWRRLMLGIGMRDPPSRLAACGYAFVVCFVGKQLSPPR